MMDVGDGTSRREQELMNARDAREKELHLMIRTTTGRAEILRRCREIRGVAEKSSMGGMFIGQMIADILGAEFDSPRKPTKKKK